MNTPNQGAFVANETNHKKVVELVKRWRVVGAAVISGLLGGVLAMFAFSTCTARKAPTSGGAGAHKRHSAPAKKAPPIDCHVRKCIALTFDDGPVPGTAKLLETLKMNGAHATFFVLGKQVGTNTDLLKQEMALGNEIGNHTYTHAKLAGAPSAKVEEEVLRAQDAIKQVTGKAPVVFRPTYGATDKQLDSLTKQEHLAQILWTVDTLDWKDHKPEVIKDRVLKAARPGHIILMHDVRPTTVAAVPGILAALSKQGYAFVTVSELYGGKLVPGQKYPPFLGSPTAGPAPIGP
jgi:peptidoglycan/xylan/chitin deacetylase (PgdA/CDA1 family)